MNLPNLVIPSLHDAVALVPEIIIAITFILVLLLDITSSKFSRTWLATVSFIGLTIAEIALIFSWFDHNMPMSVYSGSIAYDRFAVFSSTIVVAIGLLVIVISPEYLNRQNLNYGEYYALILSSLLGMTILISAASLMLVFLGIEILSISLYILTGFSRLKPDSQEGAVKYLLLGGVASGFLLYGMALIYGATGHTQLAQIASAVKDNVALGGSTFGIHNGMLMGGIALLLVGFAFKISAAPFHMWTPDVYQGAPMSVTTFMSVATKVSVFAALIRIFSYVLIPSFDNWSELIVIIAVASMFVGNVAALTQTSLKRMLGYSGIAQAGYILIGLSVHDPLGTVGALYYLAAYTVANLGAFAVLTLLSNQQKDLDNYVDIRGLWHQKPYIAGVLMLFLLSLAGFPPTAGFWGKFLIFKSAIESGRTMLAFFGILTSAISTFYYLRIGLLMIEKPGETQKLYAYSRPSRAGLSVIGIAVLGTLTLGVFVSLVYTAASMAQQGILPVG